MTCLVCRKDIVSNGWHQNFRLIQGVDTSSYLAQYRYKCGCTNNTAITAYELLNSDKVPGHLKLFYPYTARNKSMIHNDLLTLLMSDSLTGKSFHENGQMISVFRMQKYMKKRAQYVATFDSFCGKTTMNLTELEDFGTMDDSKKYNEVLQPTVEYLIQCHNDYIRTNNIDIKREQKKSSNSVYECSTCNYK